MPQVTRQVFEASKGRLKVVGRAGVGVDNVDLAAATEVRQQCSVAELSRCG
jgi:D-3-phosphoglycerate dehydrogenase